LLVLSLLLLLLAILAVIDSVEGHRREMAHGRPEFRCATAPNSTVTISQRNIVIAFLRLDFTSEVAHRNRR
jgi:hypothetical protein